MLCLAPAAIAWRTAGDPLTLEPQSRIWVDGKSTVRKFSCKAPVFTVDIDANAGAVSAVLSANKAVRSVNVRIPVEKMDCGNGTMNEHMLKALKAKEAPAIEFKLASYDVAKGATGVQGTLHGTLTLGGSTQPIAIPAQAADAGTGLLRVTGAYELHMKTFGLKPPSLMMGTMKVDEAVMVSFDLVLKSAAVAALEH
jgi:polyisoprenoid-binding protein YceI